METKMNTQYEAIWVNGPTVPFSNDFIKIKQLGRAGQYGVIYKCQRKLDGKCFAVKYLNKNRFSGMGKEYINIYLHGLKNEIYSLQTLNHENIIKLEAVYEDINTLYIVMEECKGGELFERIQKRGSYSEKDAKSIIQQILLALRYMHDDKGIVHCDLKPDNILFIDDKENSKLKLIDFGMAQYVQPSKYGMNQCGTTYYMAPEVIAKGKGYNHLCDMWSLGVILFVMIYGYPPFWVDPKQYGSMEKQAIQEKILKGFEPKIKSIAEHGYGPWFSDDHETSPELRDLISKLLETDTTKRYTAKEALSHSWFADDTNNDYIDSIIMSRLISFNTNDQFKLIIGAIFRNQFCAERYDDFCRLNQMFIRYDTEQDDVWSIEEFRNAIKSINKYINIDEMYIDIIYQQLTASPIGIEFDDLLNGLVYDYLISSDQRLHAAFNELDINNNGQISLKELKKRADSIDPYRQWDKAIDLIKQQCIDPNGGIFYDEFLLKLHPVFSAVPEWKAYLFTNIASYPVEPEEIKNNNDTYILQQNQNDLKDNMSSSSLSNNDDITANNPESPIPCICNQYVSCSYDM